MPLEAVFFQQDIFNYNERNLYSLLEEAGGNCGFDGTTTTIEKEGHDDDHEQDCKVVSSPEFLENQSEKVDHYGRNWTTTTTSTTYPPLRPPPPQQVPLEPSSMVPHLNEWCCNHIDYPNSCNNPDDVVATAGNGPMPPVISELVSFDNSSTFNVVVRPKQRSRRSRRICKNKEEIENQRMNHIAVERNRRKQMNEYLSVLRSAMPDSYVQRGDQASIIGGAINFVKELEQRLQWLVGQKQEKGEKDELKESLVISPFSEFFTFPQYSTSSSTVVAPAGVVMNYNNNAIMGENKSAIADIEVTMVESHANLKIQSRKRVPKQLLKMVSGLQCLGLTILHLNVTTTVDQIVLYCLSVKVEDDCKLNSVEEIATAAHQILDRIHEEALSLN